MQLYAHMSSKQTNTWIIDQWNLMYAAMYHD